MFLKVFVLDGIGSIIEADVDLNGYSPVAKSIYLKFWYAETFIAEMSSRRV